MNDDCRDCALLVTANPEASRLPGLHALLHEDDEDLGPCARECDWPAREVVMGEPLCQGHADAVAFL